MITYMGYDSLQFKFKAKCDSNVKSKYEQYKIIDMLNKKGQICLANKSREELWKQI